MFEQTPFLGRDKELTEIDQLIKQWGTRQILCIHGNGGIGKTRLLQEIRSTYAKPENQRLSEEIKKHMRIALLQVSPDGEWAEEFTVGVHSMAEALGADLLPFEVPFFSDIAGMKRSLSEIIQQTPDTLIIRECPYYDDLQPLIVQAIRKNIKILTFDSPLFNIQGVVTGITHNEGEGIQASIRRLIGDLKYQGHIAIIVGQDNLQNFRKDTFLRAMHDAGMIDMETCIIETYRHTDEEIEEEAYRQTIQKILPICQERNIKAIWTPWNVFARGAVRAIIDKKRNDLAVYSFDFTPEKDLDLMIRDNSPWKATVANDPREGGRLMVRLAFQAIRGNHIEPHYHLAPREISQEDLRKHANDELYLLTDKPDMGWTPELRALAVAPKYSLFMPREIIDFDDYTLRSSENMHREIARQLDQRAQIFQPFFRLQAFYRRSRETDMAPSRLQQIEQQVSDQFVRCFNGLSTQRRILLLFDTTDHLRPEDSVWQIWQAELFQLQNVVIVMAGRNAKKVGETLKTGKGEHGVHIMKLGPLSSKDRKTYLKERQKQRYITIEDQLAEKLVLLSHGRPILLDLAVEWRARGITVDWIIKKDVRELRTLNASERLIVEKKFEESLVTCIQTFHNWKHREMLLLMAYVNPVNVSMIVELMELDEVEAKQLFEEIVKYSFVKPLPRESIKLHDEMERMVQKYVWDKKTDEVVYKRREYSKSAVKYFEKTSEELSNTLQQLEVSVENARKQKRETLQSPLDIEAEEERIETGKEYEWGLRIQSLKHKLFLDLNTGFRVFTELYTEVIPSLKQEIFEVIDQYTVYFSEEQRCTRDIFYAKFLFQRGSYEKAVATCNTVLGKKISPERRIEILILLANSEIRLGKVQEAISYFEKATTRSEEATLWLWRIKSLNGLGWAYRLTGNLKEAQKHYLEARQLYWEHDGPDKPELQEDYGWICNNLVFALSNNYKYRTIAIGIARETVNHWRKINNEIGLGVGYWVLGIAHYRNGSTADAEEAFQKSLDIFEPRKEEDWLARIYSWRGALYHHLGIPEDAQKAQKDLERSLEIGTKDIKAMTLHRLGRVYMFWKEWDKAETYLKGSLQLAEQTPDYICQLGAIARLATIAAVKKDYTQMEWFESKVNELEKYDETTAGIAKLALAKLAFGQQTPDVEKIVNFLREGINLLIEYGPYLRSDILNRLRDVERIFENIPNCEHVVREVGRQLYNEYRIKEHEYKDGEPTGLNYIIVTPLMYEWAHWKEGGTNEQ